MSANQPGSPEVYLNLNVRGMGPSATLAINERSRQLQAEGRQVYRLGLGQSPFAVPGHVREAVVEWVRRAEGLEYSPDHVTAAIERMAEWAAS